MQDIFEEARKVIGPSLIRDLFDSPGSYENSGEYYLLSPIRPDKTVGSFHINLSNGLWNDHSSGESGDFIKLVSLAKGISLKQAAEDIIKGSGHIIVSPTEYQKREKPKADVPPPVIPIPEDEKTIQSLKSRVTDPWCLENWGKATAVSRYRNASGEWVFCAVRFEKEKKDGSKKRSKNDIVFYYGTDGRWIAKWHKMLQPFPLYGVEKLSGNDLPVLIVEGEKCGRVEVPGFVVLSWLGGCANVSKSAWGILKKRKVYIWPDADSTRDRDGAIKPIHEQPGMKAAYYIKSMLPQSRILDIYGAKPIDDEPGGWDIADFVSTGGNPEEFIKEYTPGKILSVEIDPWAVYTKFIEDFYDNDSLDQSGGGFWRYNDHRHYWAKTTRNDILCNLQRWMEDTGLQHIVKNKCEVTGFINKVKQYLERHSIGYEGTNPFRDAAIQPYIHLRNGAIEIENNQIGWYGRDQYEEGFFKKLHPVNCLDFNFDYDSFRNVNPEIDCPAFYFFAKEIIPKTYLSTIERAEERQRAIDDTINFLSQVLAYSLSPQKPNEYFFALYGNQRTGKSFFIKILKALIGSEFCIEKRVEDMENRFASSGFWGKKVFIEPDLKTRQPLPEDFIKAYSGEQIITIEEKHEPAQDGVRISMAMFFVSNYEFQTRGLEGLARRIVLIPFQNRIENHDTRLLSKILGKYPHGEESGSRKDESFDERPAIMALAMKAWERFGDNNFIMEIPEWAQKEKDVWLIESNSVSKFVHEEYLDGFIGETVIARPELYKKYKEYCTAEGRKPLGKKNFFEEIRRESCITEMRAGNMMSFKIDAGSNSGDEIPF